MTKEQIEIIEKEFIEGSPEVKDVLEKIHPEEVKFLGIVSPEEVMKELEPRMLGEYTNKGIYLKERFNWSIVKDDKGIEVLIAKRK